MAFSNHIVGVGTLQKEITDNGIVAGPTGIVAVAPTGVGQVFKSPRFTHLDATKPNVLENLVGQNGHAVWHTGGNVFGEGP